MWKSNIYTGVGFCRKAVWSRAFRRQVSKTSDKMEEENGDIAFGFKVYLESIVDSTIGTKLTIRWIKGHDGVLFESFCGMLKRKIEENKKSS
jgi:23S rRNA (adenine1618-N6)-methyltransferase